MDGFIGRYSNYIYSVLRIVSGFMLFWHGSQKLFGFPASASASGELAPVMAIGGGIELIGGLMIMFGLFAGLAAFISSGMMAVAYFGWHFSTQAILPLQNKGELAALYCFVFLYIAARGSGVWSIDSIFRGGPTEA